jgi:hypothetical protein
MDYAAESYADKPMYGEAIANPTHFHHIGRWQQHLRLNRIDANCRRISRNAKRSRY